VAIKSARGGHCEKLPRLTTLDLSRNLISDGTFLGSLTELTSLDLSDNKISDGRFFESLITLKRLDLSSNQIIDGRFLEKLNGLSALNLSFNKISDGRFLEKLTNLTTLDLSNNQISDLESFLPLIKKGIPVNLQRYKAGITLYENPLTTPPPEIVQQGNAAILNWFSERSKTQFQNTEIKLILIGNSTSGKTSLSRYLRERVYEYGQPTTHGIQRERWPAADDLQVNIWDFGGQEYYHATHRLFLSRNSVYVLVWDACTDKGGTEPTEIWYPEEGHSGMVSLEHFPHLWWLKNIRHFTSGSNPPVSVLLVQNKSARDGIKRLSPELEKPPFELLPEWIDNHIDIAASAQHQHDPQPDTRKWQRGFEEFEERLFDKLKSQLTHYEFAVYHRDIRDRVRALASGDNPVNEMSWTEFEEMCRDIEPDAKMDLVQIYLRDITGDILYFDKNARLRHRVFLRPDWVCNRIYTILSRKVLERQGLFDMIWVQEALQCEETEALDFVELMREFQLVFAENDENGTPTGNYVAPQYLPDACTNPGELEGAKKYANLDHAFTLWFPDFLPKSHIARFVAHWGGNAKQRLFWKNGLLFQTAGCTALVERSEELKIRVDIQQGDTAKRAAAMQRIFQSLLDLEDGQAGIAVSLNAKDFVWWPDTQEAIYTRARQVKTFPAATAKYTDIQPFLVFQKPITMAKKVFISYSKTDRAYLDTARRHLRSFERQGMIAVWDDTQLIPGELWDAAIRRELAAADLILFLVSADLLATDYIWDVEMQEAMARAGRGEVSVVPVIIRPCVWNDAPFAKYTALPAKGKAISSWSNPDEAWTEVTGRIRSFVNGATSNANPSQSSTAGSAASAHTQINDSKNVVLGDITATNIYIRDGHGGQPAHTSKREGSTSSTPILMLTANPAGTTKINLDKEHARIAEKLQEQPQRFALQVRRAVDAAGFKEFTEQVKPHILHFSGHGHGGEYGGIVLQNDDHSGMHLLAPTALGSLFEYFQEEQIGIKMVILNACYSDAQAEAIARYVPYVIGTTVEIADDAAIAFSVGFYFKLAESDMDFDKAYKSGCVQASLVGGEKSDFVLFKNGVKMAGASHPSKPHETATRGFAPTDILQWPADGCLRPTSTRTVLNELLVRRQSVNLTGREGQGKSRLLRDLKAMAAAQGLRVALLSLKEHRLQYVNFLRAAAMQLGLPRTDYTDFADLVSELSLRRDGQYLLLLDEIEVLNEYSSNDPRYNAHFVSSLNLLKNLDHLHLLCASREWLRKVVFNGETSLLTLHHIALPPLSHQEIQTELQSRLTGHALLENPTHLAQAREAVQAAAQPYALLERLISRVQMGYVAGRFDHLLKELGYGK
jgi:internalin A